MRRAPFAGKHRKNESLTRGGRSITPLWIGITESEVATNVTVKGQVTLPKPVGEAAGIRPGDRARAAGRRGDYRGRGGCEER